MILTRWNTTAGVDQLLQTVFDDSFSTWDRNESSPTWSPHINVHETSESFYVEAVMPGLNITEIEITTHKQILTIRGERKTKNHASNTSTIHLQNIIPGTFSRSLRLPEYINTDSGSAQYEQGILSLTFQKKEDVNPKPIAITPKKNTV
tara:strand:+ start:855 stop:1301 length:447 start_codon:yes stop_codon:yes gene_type:complete